MKRYDSRRCWTELQYLKSSILLLNFYEAVIYPIHAHRAARSQPTEQLDFSHHRFRELDVFEHAQAAVHLDGFGEELSRLLPVAGGVAVEEHTGRAVLRGPGARHRLERRLRRAVGRAPHEPYPAGHAADADDAAVAPRSHSGRERRYKEERRPNVAGEHPVERGHFELGGRTEERDTSVVDQDVDVADVTCEALHVGDVAEVGSDEAGLAASGGDFLDRLGAARGVAAVNQDLRPVPRQL